MDRPPMRILEAVVYYKTLKVLLFDMIRHHNKEKIDKEVEFVSYALC